MKTTQLAAALLLLAGADAAIPAGGIPKVSPHSTVSSFQFPPSPSRFPLDRTPMHLRHRCQLVYSWAPCRDTGTRFRLFIIITLQYCHLSLHRQNKKTLSFDCILHSLVLPRYLFLRHGHGGELSILLKKTRRRHNAFYRRSSITFTGIRSFGALPS